PDAGGRHVGPNDYVTIRDGQNVIYAQPGSTVNIYEGQGGYRQTGWDQRNGYIPNYDDTYRQLAASRQAQYELQTGYRPQPYYTPEYDPRYRNISGGGWEQPGYNRPNGVAQFFGSFLGAMVGVGLHGRGGYYNRGYYPQPVYYPNDCY